MRFKKRLLIIFIILTMIFAGCNNLKDTSQKQEPDNIQEEQDNIQGEQKDISQEEQLLLNGVSLSKDIISSVYRGKDSYTYEVLLYALAVNDDENNLYKGYFSYNEKNNSFIFPLEKANEILIQVFGEKEYSFDGIFDYDKESNVYYKCLDFGWNTGYVVENISSNISEDKSNIYVKFELINLWYNTGGDPVPTAIAECEIKYCIIKNNDKVYLQFENMEVVENKDISLLGEAKKYLYENWDNVKIDGSTSMIPLHKALNDMFSSNKEEVIHGKTVESFKKIINGENDILLGVTYSDELLNKAKEAGVDFVGKEITREAFVFLINKANPVKSLTVKQIKGIYSGKITNWSEVGGDDEPIIAYQRNDDSGSQIRMNIFMGDEKLVEKTYYAGGMGELILAIASFEPSSAYPYEDNYAIGYNMYTFTEKQFLNDNVVLLGVNGIYPNDDTVFDETYPIVIYNYLYYDKNNEIANKFAENLYTFLMSGEGQKLISNAGYVNIEEKLVRNLNVDYYGEYDNYISFYNEDKGEFYDVDDEGKLLVYNNYSDFALRNSQYKDNQNARDYIEKLFDANIISSRIGCNDTIDYIGIQSIWFDASFDPEDFFNIEFNGCYYSNLMYYFIEEKYVLVANSEDNLQYYREYMIEKGFPVDAILFENIEITKDDLKNIRFRERMWRYIDKFSDIQFKNPFN